MDEDKVLAAIGSTESSTFNEMCSALEGDCPEDKDGWRELFKTLRTLENGGFIDVTRVKGNIDSLILTESGANRIREKLDKRRGLFATPGV